MVGGIWDQSLGCQNHHLNPRDILKFYVRSSTKATYTWFFLVMKRGPPLVWYRSYALVPAFVPIIPQ
jgi:hypothetical protein